MWFSDFHLQLINAFQRNGVEFLIIGGHAAILYGSDRTTGDLDLLVKPTDVNGEKIIKSFEELMLKIEDLKPADFVSQLVLTFGFEPDGVDIINYLKGLEIDVVFSHAAIFDFVNCDSVKVIDAKDLLIIKKSLGREGRKALTDQLDILGIQKYLEIHKR